MSKKNYSSHSQRQQDSILLIDFTRNPEQTFTQPDSQLRNISDIKPPFTQAIIYLINKQLKSRQNKIIKMTYYFFDSTTVTQTIY